MGVAGAVLGLADRRSSSDVSPSAATGSAGRPPRRSAGSPWPPDRPGDRRDHVLLPAWRDLRSATVASTRRTAAAGGSPLWARLGLDVILLAVSAFVFWASGSNNYSLVLAPEGVAAISVSYWAFLGPALLWIGSALLLWRITTWALTHGRRPLTRLVRPLTGRLAGNHRRQHDPSHPASGPLGGPARPGRVLRSLDGHLQRHLPPAGRGRRPAHQRSGRHRHRVARCHGRSGRRRRPRRHRGCPPRRTPPAPLRLRRLGPARPLRGTTEHHHQRHGPTGRLLRRRHRAAAHRHPGHPPRLHPGQRRDRQGLPAPSWRPDQPAAAGRETQTYKTVPFHYAGIVKEFPTAPKDSFFVANADYVARATGSNAVGAFLLDTGGSNQAQVAAQVRATVGTSATVTDITQSRSPVGSSLTSVDLAGLTRIELAFAVVLAAAAAGIVLALGLAERRRTFAITTVLGATVRQTRGLVLSEAAVVTLAGLAGGASSPGPCPGCSSPC